MVWWLLPYQAPWWAKRDWRHILWWRGLSFQGGSIPVCTELCQSCCAFLRSHCEEALPRLLHTGGETVAAASERTVCGVQLGLWQRYKIWPANARIENWKYSYVPATDCKVGIHEHTFRELKGSWNSRGSPQSQRLGALTWIVKKVDCLYWAITEEEESLQASSSELLLHGVLV